MRNKNLQVMVETAVLVGAALLLSELRLWRAAYGGSITLEMLPIFVLAFRRGGAAGMLGGALLGVLQLVFGGYFFHPVQVILDYPAAFMVLGVAGFGLLGKVRWLGVTAGSLLRFALHVISGVVFFAEYTPEGSSVLGYSLLYNAHYMVPSALLAWLIIFLLERRREIFEPRA
ncbi:energy-coupled thiamine transporter ThiT [Candidatus Darwinibacter acetoxidans]|jgi:thiamine transporter